MVYDNVNQASHRHQPPLPMYSAPLIDHDPSRPSFYSRLGQIASFTIIPPVTPSSPGSFTPVTPSSPGSFTPVTPSSPVGSFSRSRRTIPSGTPSHWTSHSATSSPRTIPAGTPSRWTSHSATSSPRTFPLVTPFPLQNHSSSTGESIRVAVKPEYRISPPPQFSVHLEEIPSCEFQFDFTFERRILAEADCRNLL